MTNERPGTAREGSKEALAQLSVKRINVKQLTRLMFQIENGARPVKVRNLTVDVNPDQSGYMDATLQISAYTLKTS